MQFLFSCTYLVHDSVFKSLTNVLFFLDSCAGPIAAAIVIAVIFIVLIIVVIPISIVITYQVTYKGELCLK